MKVDTDLLISGIDYTWSGYCENKEEFINSNFLKAIENGHSVMLCSEDNMPGLCDYLFNFVLKSDLLSELLYFISPDMDYSCFLAWEQGNPPFGDCYVLDDIVQYFIDEKIIHVFQVNGNKLFVLVDFDRYEDRNFSKRVQNSIDEYCSEELLSVLDERLYGEGTTNDDRKEYIDSLLSDGRDWVIKPISIIQEKHKKSYNGKKEERIQG